MKTRSIAVALVVLWATTATAAEVYYGRLTAQSMAVNAQLIVIGTQPGATSWTYTPLPAGVPVVGTVNQFQRVVVATNATAAGVNFRLDTSQPLLASAGMDCCDFSGNIFFPTTDGKRFYGTQHVLAPLFNATVANRIRVFSRLAGTVTITNLRNAVSVSQAMVASAVWTPNFGAGGLLYLPNDVFTVTTTGEVAIAQVVGNGYSVIPPVPTGAPSPEDCDNDSGAAFIFGTHNWRTGSVAVMNNSASPVAFTLRPVTAAGLGLPITPLVVPANSIFFQAALGLATYRLDVTTPGAQVDVWAGDNEGVGNSVDTMGDDLSLNLGDNGLRFLLRSSNVGAEPGLVLFSREANTFVTATPRPASATCVAFTTTLGVDAVLTHLTTPALTKGCTWELTTTKPVTVWSFGGTSLNDSASSLRPAMAFDTDNNGIPDITEAGSCTAAGFAPDFDGDTVPNYADFDDDDDCILDTAEPSGGRLDATLPAGAHCTGITPFCDTAVHAANGSVSCRACASNAECVAATPVCVTGGGAPFQGQCIATPDTAITASPAAITNSTSATFNFTGTPAGATFQCSLNGAAFTPCAGPVGFTVSAGPNNFRVRAVAGNVVDPTPATFSWAVDTTAPAAPVVTAPASGSSTNDNTPTYSGTAEANSSVTVSVDGTAVCTVIASAGGAWTCTPAGVLGNGNHTVNAIATDAANNPSAASATNTFTVDTVAPAAPIVTAPANGSIGNDNTPTYSGTAEANSSVTVSVDGAAVCTVTASAGGAWTCTPVTVLANGSHTVSAIATDAANNPSAASATNTFTVDTLAPVAPVVVSPANGASTNDTTPTYSGTAEANSSVTVRVDGVLVCTVTATAGGAWSCTPAGALSTGSHTVSAIATDAAGNPSPPSATNTFTVDTAAPAAPVLATPVNGASINDDTPTYSGTAEANSTVTVVVDGSPVCTVVATAAGAWTCTPAAALGSGSHTATASATDAAGNTSPPSATSTFTVDTVAPAAPVVVSPENGASTNDTTPTYSGTAEANSSVTVRVDGVLVCTVTATAGGAWTCTPVAALATGTHTVDAIATDAASNVSAPSATHSFTVDTVGPAAPALNFPANGSFTNSATPAYSGTAEAFTTVSVSVDGAVVCTAVTSATGSFSCVQPVALAAGSHAANAIARDAANNASPVSNTNNFTVDTVSPVAPVVTSPANGSSTNNPTPTFSGTAEANSTVAVVVDGGLACITTANALGAWSCTQPMTLADGSHAVTATARDAANNVSPVSSTNTFTIDTAVPAAPVLSTPANASVSSNNFPTYSGTAEAGATVTVRVDGVVACTTLATAAGTFSCAQPTALLEGSHTANASATDVAGNVSAVSNTTSFTIDAGPPAAPVITSPANNSASSSNLPTYSGTAEPGSTVTVSVDGAVACTAIASATGAWSCVQPTALVDGPHTVNATAKDAANNTSPPSATSAFGVDTNAPDTSIVSGPPAQDPATSAVFDFASTEAGVTYECSLDGSAFAPCSDPATFSMLAAGIHTLQVRAKDAAGNVDPTPAQRQWEVLPQLDTTIVSGPAALTKDSAAAFDFASNTANVTFECSLDGAAFAPCTDPSTFTVPDGPHSLRVRAKDALGNIDTSPALHLWIQDTLAPGAPVVTSPTSGSTLGITPPTLTGTAEPGSTVTVIIDGVVAGTALVDASGNWTFTPAAPLPNGMHTVSASAQDPAGNTSPASAPTTFTIDPTVIDTTIVAGPSGVTNSKSALFDFASNKPGVSYECSLDGSAFAACSDPSTFANLADGPHTLVVRAKDGMGNVDASPASRLWKIDTVVPAAAVVTSPANNATVGTTTPIIRGTAEAGSTVTILIDGIVVGTALADANGNWSFTPAALSPGGHTVAARATDQGGNVGPDSPINSFTVDTSALDTIIVSGPMAVSRFTTAAFDLASNKPNVTYECSLDGGAFAACADPATFTGLTEGSHTVLVRANDGMGNVDATPAGFTWVVDTLAPAAPIVVTPANGATLVDSRPAITGTAEAGALVTVSIDGQPVGTVTADAAGNWTLPTSAALADGSHTVSAVATDAVGNKGPVSATHTFTIVTAVLAAPTITTPANAAITTDSTPTLTGKAPPNSTVRIFIDGIQIGTTTADANGDWTFTPSAALTDGAHTLTAQAEKGLQRSAISAPTMITVDATPPSVQIVTGPPAQNVDPISSFEFGSDDPAATYECSLDGGPFEPCTRKHNVTLLLPGTHTLTVRAVDAAGNRSVTPATFTWARVKPIEPRPNQTLVGGGCGYSAADPGAIFALFALLAVARRRVRRG